MARGGGVRIPIDVDPSGAVRGINKVERQLDGLSRGGVKSMNLLKGAGLAAGAAIGAGLTAVISTGVSEMIEFEKVAARTANVIETTGGKAGVTAKHVEELANKLQQLTGSEDDVIQSGANVILTFDRISAKGGVFDRTVAIANDMSVAMGRDITASARALGRALQDPEKGLGGLSRAGVIFNKDQKEAIKTWIKHGEVVRAQTLILNEVEKRFKGAAQSEGQTTEAVQKAQRTFEEFSQEVIQRVLPALAAIIEWARRNWPEFRRRFNEHFGPMIDRLRRFGEIVADMVRLVRAILRGDWSQAWQAARRIVTNFAAQIVDDLLRLPRRLIAIGRQLAGAIGRGISSAARAVFDQARRIGIALINGIVQGVKDAAGRIGSAVVDAIRGAGSSATGALGDIGRAILPGLASGGTVPGELGAPVPIMAHAGEVVLNPEQQRQLGVDRIMSVLRRTGGVIGRPGSAMARGGVLDPAIAFARAQVGEPYLWGGGHAFGDFRAWDCSGFASNVAARIPGYTGGIGTTYTLYPKSSPASGSEPVVFGFRSGNTHMGIRVAGTWYDAGSGGVQVGDSRWDSLRVPPGLSYLASLDPARSIQSGDGPDPGPARAPDRRTPLEKITDLIGKTGLFKDNTKGAGALGRTLLRDVPNLSEGSAPSFTGAQERGIAGAGRTARAAARAAGKSPEQVAREGEAAERFTEKKVLNKQLRAAKADMRRLSRAKGKLLGQFQRLGRKRVGAAALPAKKQLMAKMRRKLAEFTDEINEVREEIAQIKERLVELGETEAEERYEEAYEAATATAEATTPTEPTTPADTGPTPDQQALIDQANERARVAERAARLSDVFTRTLFTSGSIDPASGVMNVNVNVEGNLVHQGQLASWLVGVLGGQGSVPASAFRVGV